MYLVAGATTSVGRELVPKLLRRAVPVRVMVRRDADREFFAKFGAEVVQADLRDAAAVGRAVGDVNTVISLVGRHFAATEAEFWAVEVQGAQTLIRAAREARVDHFVLLSVLWSDRDPGPLIFRAKRQAEDFLMQSGLRYTILRPSMFATGPPGSGASLVGGLGRLFERYGLALVPAPDSQPIAPLTLDDLSEALLAATVSQGAESRVYDLAGPEGLSLGGWARRIGGLLNKKVRVIRAPRFVLRVLRALSRLGGFATYERMLFAEMLADHGFFCEEGRNRIRELLGREPQSVDAALRAYCVGDAAGGGPGR